MAAFKQAELREIESMQELRQRNIERHANHSADSKYCVCRKGPMGFMLMCELCKDWFHCKYGPEAFSVLQISLEMLSGQRKQVVNPDIEIS